MFRSPNLCNKRNQVSFQGIPHQHTIEVRDRFGNLLDSYPNNGGFTTTVIGTPDSRAGVTVASGDEESGASVIVAATVSNETDAHGQLKVTFTPDIAGTYVMSNEYTGPGGLLATFYRTKDFTDPVLENPAYAIEVKRHVQASPTLIIGTLGASLRHLSLPLVW